jgi:intraflagellar transport protein 88
LALEKAKEAGKKERGLCRHREKNGLADQLNFDLTYAVCFNLAHQYHAMKVRIHFYSFHTP